MDTLTKILILLLSAALIGLTVWNWTLARELADTKPTVEYKDVYQTIRDTVYSPKPVKEYIVRKDTVRLTTTDTVEVLVEVPITKYVIDTTTPDSVRFKATLEGYGARIDSLSVEVPVKVQEVNITPPDERKWRTGFGFALGWGWGYSK